MRLGCPTLTSVEKEEEQELESSGMPNYEDVQSHIL